MFCYPKEMELEIKKKKPFKKVEIKNSHMFNNSKTHLQTIHYKISKF